PGSAQLPLGEEREPLRRDGRFPELLRRADDEPLPRHVRGGVALERLAHRCAGGLGTGGPATADREKTAEWRADEPFAGRKPAGPLEEPRVRGAVKALLDGAHDAGVRGDGSAEPGRERGDHAASPSCQGTGEASLSAVEHAGQRGTRSTGWDASDAGGPASRACSSPGRRGSWPPTQPRARWAATPATIASSGAPGSTAIGARSMRAKSAAYSTWP